MNARRYFCLARYMEIKHSFATLVDRGCFYHLCFLVRHFKLQWLSPVKWREAVTSFTTVSHNIRTDEFYKHIHTSLILYIYIHTSWLYVYFLLYFYGLLSSREGFTLLYYIYVRVNSEFLTNYCWEMYNFQQQLHYQYTRIDFFTFFHVMSS